MTNPENSTPAPPPEPAESLTISEDMLDAGEPDVVEFERGMSFFPKLSLILIALNVLFFGWQLFSGSLTSEEAIVQAGALRRTEVMSGEVWRLLSAAFLHGSVDHLIGNCIFLYILGMACEHALGMTQTSLTYFLSAMTGSLLSILLNEGPSVGASGAIFGLTGSLMVFFYRFKNFFELRDRRIGIVLLVWAIYAVASGFMTPMVDNFCHIGGFLGGAAITFALRPEILARESA